MQLALNTEEVELIIAHGAQLRDTSFVCACRCTCKRLKEAVTPWVLFYAEERPVHWGRLFAGHKQLRTNDRRDLSRWIERGAYSGSLASVDLSQNKLEAKDANILVPALAAMPCAREVPRLSEPFLNQSVVARGRCAAVERVRSSVSCASRYR